MSVIGGYGMPWGCVMEWPLGGWAFIVGGSDPSAVRHVRRDLVRTGGGGESYCSRDAMKVNCQRDVTHGLAIRIVSPHVGQMAACGVAWL